MIVDLGEGGFGRRASEKFQASEPGGDGLVFLDECAGAGRDPFQKGAGGLVPLGWNGCRFGDHEVFVFRRVDARRPPARFVERNRALAVDGLREEVEQPLRLDRAGDADDRLPTDLPPRFARVDRQEELGIADERLRGQPDASPADHAGRAQAGASPATDAVGIGQQRKADQQILAGLRVTDPQRPLPKPHQVVTDLNHTAGGGRVDPTLAKRRRESSAGGLIERVEPRDQIGRPVRDFTPRSARF